MAAAKVGPGRGRDLLLVGEGRVGEAHLRRHRLLEGGLQGLQGLPGGEPTPRHALQLDRPEQVEAVRELGARLRGDGHERAERDHVARGRAADVDLADVVGLAPEVRLRLHVHAKEAAEPVEVVHVAAAQAGGERLEGLVDGDAELARLLAVELHLDLGIARIERGEEVADLRPLARRLLELAAQLAETVDAQAAAPVLEEEVEAGGGAEARDGGDVEREDDRLGDGGDLGGDAAHEPAHVHRVAVAFRPGLQPDEDRPEVGLVGAGDDAEAADRLVGLHTLGLAPGSPRPGPAPRSCARGRRPGAGSR